MIAPEAGTRLEASIWHTRRLWSLWEMLQNIAWYTFTLSEGISQLETALNSADGPISPKVITRVNEFSQKWEIHPALLGHFPFVAAHLRRANKELFSKTPTKHDLLRFFGELKTRMSDELENKWFLHITG